MSAENYYRNLAEIYQLQYNDQIEVAEACMIVQGICVEMMSDIIGYEKKHGTSEKLKKSTERIQLLLSKVNRLSQIQSDNYALKLVNRRLLNHISILQGRLNEEKRQDDMIFNFENTEIPTIPNL